MMKELLVYCMMMANPAPSSMPSPLLHFTLDPQMHQFVALRIDIILQMLQAITVEPPYSRHTIILGPMGLAVPVYIHTALHLTSY